MSSSLQRFGKPILHRLRYSLFCWSLMSVTWGKIPRLSGETFRSTTCKFRQKEMRGTIPTIKSCIFHGNPPPNTVHNWDDPQKNCNPIQRTLGSFSRLPEPTGFRRWWFSYSIYINPKLEKATEKPLLKSNSPWLCLGMKDINLLPSFL